MTVPVSDVESTLAYLRRLGYQCDADSFSIQMDNGPELVFINYKEKTCKEETFSH